PSSRPARRSAGSKRGSRRSYSACAARSWRALISAQELSSFHQLEIRSQAVSLAAARRAEARD
ncbi:hypothetical protein ACFCXR_40355, partial [Streptomyces noursei]|uniref:hypothetical protein n=1 Tax=Streptomyces noursei TaxID=1971 RepID=UPI0035D79658